MSNVEGSTLPLLGNDQPLSTFAALGFIGGTWARLSGHQIAGAVFASSVLVGGDTTLDDAIHKPGCLLKCNYPTGFTLTVPPDADFDFPVGFGMVLLRANVGQITVAGGSGVSMFFGNSNRNKFNGTGAVCYLWKVGANEWVFTGDATN